MYGTKNGILKERYEVCLWHILENHVYCCLQVQIMQSRGSLQDNSHSNRQILITNETIQSSSENDTVKSTYYFRGEKTLQENPTM